MKKILSIFMFVLVSVSFLKASSNVSLVEELSINFALILIGTFYSVLIYFLYSYANKYRLGFVASYIENVVKRVEQETKSKAKVFIHDKYKEIAIDNKKLARALSIINGEYSTFFRSLYAQFIGLFGDKIVTVIEAKVYDIKAK